MCLAGWFTVPSLSEDSKFQICVVIFDKLKPDYPDISAKPFGHARTLPQRHSRENGGPFLALEQAATWAAAFVRDDCSDIYRRDRTGGNAGVIRN